MWYITSEKQNVKNTNCWGENGETGTLQYGRYKDFDEQFGNIQQRWKGTSLWPRILLPDTIPREPPHICPRREVQGWSLRPFLSRKNLEAGLEFVTEEMEY